MKKFFRWFTSNKEQKPTQVNPIQDVPEEPMQVHRGNPLQEWLKPIDASIPVDDFFDLANCKLNELAFTSPDAETIHTFCEKFAKRQSHILTREHFSGNSGETVIKSTTEFYTTVNDLFGSTFDVMSFLEEQKAKRKERLEKLRNDAEEARLKRLERDKEFRQVMELRYEASDLEDSGQLQMAAEKYETAIAFGASCSLNPMNYYGCMERLLVIYRKLKRYADEERVILNMLAVCAAKSEKASGFFDRKIEKLQARLVKCQTLLSKSLSNE